MSKESRQLEEAKLRLQLKQALLFEQRLDHYLAISSETDSQKRKEIFQNLLKAEPITKSEIIKEAIEKNLVEKEENEN